MGLISNRINSTILLLKRFIFGKFNACDSRYEFINEYWPRSRYDCLIGI